MRTRFWSNTAVREGVRVTFNNDLAGIIASRTIKDNTKKPLEEKMS